MGFVREPEQLPQRHAPSAPASIGPDEVARIGQRIDDSVTREIQYGRFGSYAALEESGNRLNQPPIARVAARTRQQFDFEVGRPVPV